MAQTEQVSGTPHQHCLCNSPQTVCISPCSRQPGRSHRQHRQTRWLSADPPAAHSGWGCCLWDCAAGQDLERRKLLLKGKGLFTFAVLESHPVAILVRSAISCLPPILLDAVMTLCQLYAVLSHFLARDSNVRKKKNKKQFKAAQDRLCNSIFPRTFKDSCPKDLGLFRAGFSDASSYLTKKTEHTVFCVIA